MTTQTTKTSATAWSPDVSTFDPGDVVPGSLVLQTATQAGVVQGDAPAVRVAYAQDAVAGFVAEGAAIEESDPTLAERLVFTGKISQLVSVSREQWNQDGAANLLSQSVARAVTKAANRAYIAQAAPVAPATTPPAGLLNIVGIEAAAADVTGNLDTLVDLVAALEGNGATPSHIVMDPLGWATISKMKIGGNYNASLLGAGTQPAPRMLLGLPVLVTDAMTANTGLVIDKTQILSAVGQLEIATSEHAKFASDNILIRATWRFGANVLRADRLGSFEVAEPEVVGG